MASFSKTSEPQPSAVEAEEACSLGLSDMPVEIIIEIISYLDFPSFDILFCSSRWLRNIITAHWAHIFPAIVARDFSPVVLFNEAFEEAVLPKYEEDEGHHHHHHHHHRHHHHHHHHHQQIINHEDEQENLDNENKKDDEDIETETTYLASLSPLHLRPLLNFCRAIFRWQSTFQYLRFADCPEHGRALRPHELRRLRRALYIWWLYASHFHTPTILGVCSLSTEILEAGGWYMLEEEWQNMRMDFLRRFTTSTVRELCDLWRTVRAAVGREVCPSEGVVKKVTVSFSLDMDLVKVAVTDFG